MIDVIIGNYNGTRHNKTTQQGVIDDQTILNNIFCFLEFKKVIRIGLDIVFLAHPVIQKMLKIIKKHMKLSIELSIKYS